MRQDLKSGDSLSNDKKSKVRLPLVEVDPKKAKCNICAKDLMAKAGHTTNLIWITIIERINKGLVL